MSRPKHLIPLTKAHYTAIGRVATEWSALENFIGYAVRVLIDGDSRASLIVTADLQFRSACDLLMALVRQRLRRGPDVERFCKIVGNLNESRPDRKSPRVRRNEIVHGSWVRAGSPRRVFVVIHKARGILRSRSQPHTAAQIDAFAHEIAEITGEVMNLAEPLLERSCRILGVTWHGLEK